MTKSSLATVESHLELRQRLFDADLLFATGVDGVYGRSETYEGVVRAVDGMVHRWAETLGATTVHLPPVLTRSAFDGTEYLRAFPDLMGSVHVFEGTDRDHAELVRRVESVGDWPALLNPAEVVLAPAICHALYPMCTGRLPDGGRYFEASGFCFRHEPSVDPTRLQSFHQHDVVYIGDAEAAARHRDDGLAIGISLLERIGLPMTSVPANDPFFGRLGAALAAGQIDEELKFEGVTPIFPDKPTAVMSANCHGDHFGRPFGIETASGEVAHSSCIGFGADRITIALLARHGFDPSGWPEPVVSELFG